MTPSTKDMVVKGILLATVCYSLASVNEAAEIPLASVHPGLRNIATGVYSPTVMDPVVFANLWRSWDTPSRLIAEKASEKARRDMTLTRYGLLDAPYDNGGAPLGMVVTKDGSWAMSCGAIGTLAGQLRMRSLAARSLSARLFTLSIQPRD